MKSKKNNSSKTNSTSTQFQHKLRQQNKHVVLTIFLALALGAILPTAQYWQKNASAQENQSLNNPEPNDVQLAHIIQRLTDRSTVGLNIEINADGGETVDLQNRFQNVMLAKIAPDGEPEAACVTDISEANAFYGRNLETGETIASTQLRGDETARTANRHGMSKNEYLFYKKLIEDAAQRHSANPDSAILNIVNGDGAGEGFNDATAVAPEGNNNGTTRGEQRLNLFQFAAGIWGAFLDTSVPVNINSQFNPLTPCSTSGGVLGSAGTVNVSRDFPNAEFADTWYHAALANKRAGSDLVPANAEINARFNSDVDNGCLGAGSRFYYGLDNSTPSQRINLLIVLLHEMGHGLGFSSFASGSTGALFNGSPDIFTRYMFDRSANKFWYQMTDAERQASAINNSNVLWDGPSVRNASGSLTGGREASTGRVQLYTPSTFQQGSSVSHFDTAVSPNALMEPNINVGIPLSLDLTRQQMRDIGWYRDTTSDLIPDTITNVQPSGSNLTIGSTVNITWTNTGGFNRNISIELSTDGGATFSTAVATDFVNNGTFSFTVPNLPTAQGRIRIREHNFVAPAGVSSANFTIGTGGPAPRRAFDFDGDGKADVSVFRPSNGAWYLLRSQSGFSGVQWGANGDKLAPADFDGDGKTDFAVMRPSNGVWYILNSQNSTITSVQFGTAEDLPRPADFDGDGKADVSVFRPSNGTWFRNNSGNGLFVSTQFGANGDIPQPADFDGDGKADINVFRPATGAWYRFNSNGGAFFAVQFGANTDSPVAADFDGDNKADISVFRPSNGVWYRINSNGGTISQIQFGTSGDQPSPADYDGDGRADVAVFRGGTWFILQSTAGFSSVPFGSNGDKAIPSAYTQP